MKWMLALKFKNNRWGVMRHGIMLFTMVCYAILPFICGLYILCWIAIHML